MAKQYIVRITARVETWELFRETETLKLVFQGNDGPLVIYDHRKQVIHYARMWEQYGERCWEKFGYNAAEKLWNEFNQHAALSILTQFGRRNFHLHDTSESPNAYMFFHERHDRFATDIKRYNPLYFWSSEIDQYPMMVTVTDVNHTVELEYRPQTRLEGNTSFRVCLSDKYTCNSR